MSKVVLVHGIGQQSQESDPLRDVWLEAIHAETSGSPSSPLASTSRTWRWPSMEICFARRAHKGPNDLTRCPTTPSSSAIGQPRNRQQAQIAKAVDGKRKRNRKHRVTRNQSLVDVLARRIGPYPRCTIRRARQRDDGADDDVDAEIQHHEDECGDEPFDIDGSNQFLVEERNQ
jgi:hypothetical protein